MLFVQRVGIFTDYINLSRDAVGITSDQVYRWRFLIEDNGPEIMYIKGVYNIVADTISKLDYNAIKNCHAADEDSGEYSSEY